VQTNLFTKNILYQKKNNTPNISTISTLGVKMERFINRVIFVLQSCNKCSRRSWVRPGTNLYKGNGRVKHEQHRIPPEPLYFIADSAYSGSQHNPIQEDLKERKFSPQIVEKGVRNQSLTPRQRF
jgi:hypothetical protein